jgi:HD-like signal output (HDOD) protein
LVVAEQSRLGFSYVALGARLLARWGLPPNVGLAVELHYQSPADTEQYLPLAAVTNIANSLAHQINEGTS